MEPIHYSPVFAGLTPEEIDRLLDDHTQEKYFRKGDFILRRGEPYKSLLILTKGEVHAQMNNCRGDKVIIADFHPPKPVISTMLFASDNRSPVDLLATTESEVTTISKEYFTYLMQTNSLIFLNTTRHISDRALFLVNKSTYLFTGPSNANSSIILLITWTETGRLNLTYTIRTNIWQIFLVWTRPALSRAFIQLEEMGAIIKHSGKHYWVNEKILRAAALV
jgi:CRP-like cAMP-binding protein